jgi:integrase
MPRALPRSDPQSVRVRVGEANNLKVCDVQQAKDDLGRENVQFRVHGKSGTRVVVPHIDAKQVIDALLARRGNLSPNEWLFAKADGSKVLNLWDQFDVLLRRSALAYDGAGSKHSLYGLRHFYAVRAIARDVDVYTPAKSRISVYTACSKMPVSQSASLIMIL